MTIKNAFYSFVVITTFSSPIFSKKFNSLEVQNDATIDGNLHVEGNVIIDSLSNGIAQINNNHHLISGDLPDNSVNTAQLVNGAVETDTIASEAVTLDKIQQPLSGDFSVSGNITYQGSNYNVIGSKSLSNVFALFGTIDADGNIVEGSGFSATRNDKGVYTITFTPNPFADANSYEIFVQTSKSNHKMGFVFADKVDGNSCTITTYKTSLDTWNPTAQDRLFHFIAIGN